MKKYLLATASAIAMAHGASAADMPVAPRAVVVAPLWEGWYLGVQGGAVSSFGTFHDLALVTSSANWNTDRIGGAVGVSGRWLRQSDSFVYGLDADWMWIGAKASFTHVFPGIGNTPQTLTVDPNWLATVRATMGLAVNRTLVYVAGGLAFGQVKNSFTRPIPGFDQAWNDNSVRVGWTGAVGVAHQITSAWSVRAEGRYVDLGRRTVDCTSSTTFACQIGGTNYRGEFSNHMFMGLLGLDFKF
jgi:outer membrane immunogenic protein